MRRLGLLGAALLLMGAGPEAAAPPGASSCTGCHVKGGGMGLLLGLPAADTISAMEGYRSGARASTLMGRIARGFTPDEVVAIALWFEKQ